MSDNFDEIAQFNARSLSTLARAILLARCQFSLILVRCNYASLQEYMGQELQKCLGAALEPGQIVRELYLPASITTLFTTILASLDRQAEDQIAALMVFGLESANALDRVLVATNQVRDEFRKHFPFPIVLWVTDEVLQKLTRFAPDFKSWAAASIKFELTSSESITLWWQTTDNLFKRLLVAGADRFLPNEVLDLAPGCRDRRELEFARAEVRSAQSSLAPASEATWQFILGRDAYGNRQIEQALGHYRQSAGFWCQGTHYWEFKIERLAESPNPLTSDRERAICNPFLEQKGLLLFHLGLCYCAQARQHLAIGREYWREAQTCFGASLEIFAVKQFPELVAQLTIQLGGVLQQLGRWQELEVLSLHALKQPATFSDRERQARAYGFLAQVALGQLNAQEAEFWVFRALEIQSRAQPIVLQHRALYLLLLAKAKHYLGQTDRAISLLEQARKLLYRHVAGGRSGEASTETSGDKGVAEKERLYLEILESLSSLYFEQHQYQLAFELKQEQQAIEQLFGLRAFRGAAPLRHPNTSLPRGLKLAKSPLPTYQQEIIAAGRQHDVSDLLERLRRSEHKLTVIHGASGVGKSNLLHAGLVPALWGQIVAAREVIPAIQTVYRDWQQGFCQAIAKAMSEFYRIAKGGEPPIPSSTVRSAKPSLEESFEQLRRNSQTHLLTILIFDQFEEFFFLCPKAEQQQKFYHFLRDCLNLPYVKVILCLREDYLHYLLRIEQNIDLAVINNNLLDRQIRYSLQDLTPANATQVIRFLTVRSHLYLEDALIERLVRDLAQERGTVRPIELQVVGAALQAEKITALQQYEQLGADPKTVLVERWLQGAIADCGPENENAVWHILFALTNERGTRPLRTQAELLNRQKTSTELLLRSPPRHRSSQSDRAQRWTDKGEQTSDKLDLILTILIGSGLVFRILDEPEDRYQLVHDYLVKPIRDQFNRRLQRLLADRLENSEVQLVRASKQRLRAIIVGAAMTLLAIAAVLLGSQVDRQRRLALEASFNAELLALSSSSEALYASDKQFDALLEALRAAKMMQNSGKQRMGTRLFSARSAVKTDTHFKVVTALEQAVYGVLERNRLQGHRDIVWNLCFSPDGQYIAAASRDKTATLWHPNGNLAAVLTGHTNSVTAVDMSADGLLASSSWDGTLRLWKLDGTLVRTITVGDDYLYSVAFSPDGRHLLSASADGTVKRWSLEGQLLSTLRGHKGKVNWVSFSPDGNTIASAGDDGTVRLWSLEGKLLKILKGHQKRVNYVSYSSQGDLIATASHDGTAKLWSRQGQLLKTLSGHQSFVYAVRFSPDDRTIASASDDNTIALWNRQGKRLKTLKGHSDGVTGISFSPDGSTLASSSSDKTIELWAFESRDRAVLKGHQAPIRDAVFSADGSLVATASDDQTAKLWMRDGRLLATLQGHSDGVERVSFSPDGQWLATGSRDNTVKIWNRQGKLLAALQGHRDRVLDVAWSPNSQWLASGSVDNTVKVWNYQGVLLATLKGHSSRINAVAFSPDGEFLAAASDDKTVSIWQLDRSQPSRIERVKTLRGHENWVLDVTFLPSSSERAPNAHPWIASASYDNTVKFWSFSGQELQTLKGHPDSVARLSVHPTGKILATATWNNAFYLWRLDDTLLATLSGHHDRVTNVNWSPDGSAIVTASLDNTAVLWNLNAEDLTRLGCNWLQDYFQHNRQIRKGDLSLCDRAGI